MFAAVSLAFAAAAMAFQEPKPAAEPADKEAPEQPRLYTSSQARTALREFTRAMRAKAPIAARLAALDALGRGAHESLVKPLARVVASDKSTLVRRRASVLLGMQPGAAAAIARLLEDRSLSDEPTVQADLVAAIARAGYEPKHWATLEKLFEKDYAADRILLQERILLLAAAKREKQAISLLLRNLDEPLPENVDAPDNPPRDYWEARWKAWRSFRGKVKDALFAVTGQRFGSAREAKEWLEKNGK
ncbi:MAG: hypothetical protein Fur0037_01850 [Planctomycetota bacterium]